MRQTGPRHFPVAAARALGIALLQLALLPAIAQTSAPTRQTVRWQVFESAAGKFRVVFPEAPTTSAGKMRTDIGEVLSTRHTAWDGGGTTYDVRINEYPKAGIDRLTAEKLLDAARDGLIYRANGKLESEKAITWEKLPGRDQVIVAENGMRYRVRLLLLGSRLYQLTAMARAPNLADEQRFIDSFQLIR